MRYCTEMVHHVGTLVGLETFWYDSTCIPQHTGCLVCMDYLRLRLTSSCRHWTLGLTDASATGRSLSCVYVSTIHLTRIHSQPQCLCRQQSTFSSRWTDVRKWNFFFELVLRWPMQKIKRLAGLVCSSRNGSSSLKLGLNLVELFTADPSVTRKIQSVDWIVLVETNFKCFASHVTHLVVT